MADILRCFIEPNFQQEFLFKAKEPMSVSGIVHIIDIFANGNELKVQEKSFEKLCNILFMTLKYQVHVSYFYPNWIDVLKNHLESLVGLAEKLKVSPEAWNSFKKLMISVIFFHLTLVLSIIRTYGSSFPPKYSAEIIRKA